MGRLGHRPPIRGNIALSAAFWLLALSVLSLLMWSGSEAAFVSQTNNPANTLGLGTLTAPNPSPAAGPAPTPSS